MATKKTIFIIRDEDLGNEHFEEMQSVWLDENYPDKTIIAGEETGDILVSEEDKSLLCMEYINYDN